MDRRFSWPLLLALVAALLFVVPPVPAQTAAGLVRSLDADVPAHDGTLLSTRTYYLDAGGSTPAPLVITAHGWGADKGSRFDHASDLARRGYTVITYDARGFGKSGGSVGLDGPEEVKDVSTLIDWALGFGTTSGLEWIPPVATNDKGDPLVGMTGESYGGAVQLLAAAADPRIDAVVPEITWSDLVEALAPGTVVNRGWVDMLFFYGLLSSHGVTGTSPNAGGLDDRLAQWYLEAYETGRLSAEATSALSERSPSAVLDRIKADVLLVHGYRDTLFVPDQALLTYDGLSGRDDADTHLMFHGAGHGFSRSAPEKERVRDATYAFFAKHLRLDSSATTLPPVAYWLPSENKWVTTDAWPPSGLELQESDLTATATQVTLRQAAAPTSHTQAPNLEESSPAGMQDAPIPTSVLLATGIKGPFDWAGKPTVRLSVTPDVDDLTLFVSLVDADAERSRVVGGQVTPIRIEGKAGDAVDLEVPIRAGAYRLGAGHTLSVRVTTSDSAFLGGRDAGTVVVDLSEATLAVPAGDITDDTWIPPALAPAKPKAQDAPMAAPALVAFTLVAAAGVLRRHLRP